MKRFKDRYAYPGRKIAVIEELFPGVGTYKDRHGAIRSRYVGQVEVDVEDMKIKVSPLKEALCLRPRDEVMGVVLRLTGVFGTVYIEILNDTPLKKPVLAILYPSRALMRGKRQYNKGDIIYAYVESLTNRAVHLSIEGDRYGVIKTRCSTCGEVLLRPRKGSKTLKCQECGGKESRKISGLYRRII